MKNTCRRLFGLLMVLVMVSVSADFPVVSGQTTAAIADAESATVPDAGSVEDNSADTDRDSDKQPASVRYAYLSELLSQYFAGTKDGSGNTDPSAVLEERWTGLTKEEQNLFVLLKDGTWEFVRSNTGEIIGAREKTFEVDLASGDGNAEIPGAAVTEPEKDIPVINIEDPVIDVTPDVPDADNVPEIPDTADIADLPDNFMDELPDSAGDLIPDDLPEQDAFTDLANTADIDNTVDPDMADAPEAGLVSDVPEEPAQDPVDGADIPDTDDQGADADSEEPVIPDEADVDANADNADEPDAADEQDGENVPADIGDSDDAEEQDEEEVPAIADADENDTDKTEPDEDNNQEEADSADSDTAEQEEKADDKTKEPDADTDDTDEFRAMPIVGAVRRGAEPTDEEEKETINYAEPNHTSGIYDGEDQKTKCTSWTIKTTEDSTLVPGTDYTVSVSADEVINAGTYTTTWELTDSGKEKFTIGEDVAKTSTYTIEKRMIASVAFAYEKIVFDGKNHIDEVRAGWTFAYGDNGNLKLEEGTDYVVKISDDNGTTERVIDAGKYTVSWELTGSAAKNYDDSSASLKKDAAYLISKIKIGEAVFSVNPIVYDGKNHIQDLRAGWKFKDDKNGELSLVLGTDYDVNVKIDGTETDSVIEPDEYTVSWELTEDAKKNYDDTDGELKKEAICTVSKATIKTAKYNIKWIKYDNSNHYNKMLAGWDFLDDSDEKIELSEAECTVKVYKNNSQYNRARSRGNYTVTWELTAEGSQKYKIAEGVKTEAVCEIKDVGIKSAKFTVNNIIYDGNDYYNDLINGWEFKDTDGNPLTLKRGEQYTVHVIFNDQEVYEAKDAGTYTVSWELTKDWENNYYLEEGLPYSAQFSIQKNIITEAAFSIEKIAFNGENHKQELLKGWTFRGEYAEFGLVLNEDYKITISKDGSVVQEVIDIGTYKVSWELTYKGSQKYSLAKDIVTSVDVSIEKATIASAEYRPGEIYFDGKEHIQDIKEKLVFIGSDGLVVGVLPGDFDVTIKKGDAEVKSVKTVGTYNVEWKLNTEGTEKYCVTDGTIHTAQFTIKKTTIDRAEYKRLSITYDAKEHIQDLKDGWKFWDKNNNEIILDDTDCTITVYNCKEQADVTTVKDAVAYKIRWEMKENGNCTEEPSLNHEWTFEINKAHVMRLEMEEQIEETKGQDTVINYTKDITFVTDDQVKISAIPGKDYESLTYEYWDYINEKWLPDRNPVGTGLYKVQVVLNKDGNYIGDNWKVERGGEYKLIITGKKIVATIEDNKKIYSGDDWTETVLNNILVTSHGEPLNNKPYTVEITHGENKIQNAGNYIITVTGNAGTDYEQSVSSVNFTIEPATIDSVSLAYNRAGYDSTDWYSRIKICDKKKIEKEIKNGNNPLIIKTIAVEHPNEAASPYILTTEDLRLSGNNHSMINAGTYEVVWRLKKPENFIWEDETSVGFTVAQAEFNSAEFVTKPVFSWKNWFDQIFIGEQLPEDKSVLLKITANTELPNNNEEGKEYKEITLTSENVLISEQELINAGTYDIEWNLTEKGKVNYHVSDEVIRTVQLEILPINIVDARIYNQDGQIDYEVVYNGENWKNKFFPQKDGNNKEGYFFVVKAKAKTNDTDSYDLKDDDFSLKFNPEEIINVGEYVVSIDPSTNFKIGEDFDNKLIFKVTPYPALPLKDETESVREPSKEHPVTFKGVYHMGPKQDNGARTLTISGEPGQTVVLEINGKKAEFKFEGTAYDNYPNTSEEPEKLQITFNANGVLLDQEKKETGLKLLENEETTVTLSYENTNLKKMEDDDPPASLDIKVLFDTIKPDLTDAIDNFANRAKEVKFKVPEPGRLEAIRFNEYTEPCGDVYNDVSKDYGNYVESKAIRWDTDLKLIQAGDKAMEVHYTDLACNETIEQFAVGRSGGMPIKIEVQPVTSNDRIDMSSKPEKVSINITGTGYEKLDVFVQPNVFTSEGNDNFTGSGNWDTTNMGFYNRELNTSSFPDNAEITVTARYHDLSGGEESISFYFDETADAMVMTMPQVTEDNWVISGIAEPGSTVEVYVNGERVSNRVFDSYTIFTARQPQMEVGDTVRIVATDLSGNRSEATTTIEAGPSNGKQVMGAYAMGKVYTDAHTNKEDPGWMMAGLYTEEELLAGVKVPLVAANAFHIGEVSLQLKDGKPEYSFIPAEGVELSGQHIDILPAENKTFSYTKYQKELAEGTGTEGQKIGYWVVASAEAEIPVELLHNSFQLDEEQEDIRALYFNRQRLNTLPTDEQP